MKAKASKWLEIVIESINYIIINYALSNMAMILKSNPLFYFVFCVGSVDHEHLLAKGS